MLFLETNICIHMLAICQLLLGLWMGLFTYPPKEWLLVVNHLSVTLHLLVSQSGCITRYVRPVTISNISEIKIFVNLILVFSYCSLSHFLPLTLESHSFWLSYCSLYYKHVNVCSRTLWMVIWVWQQLNINCLFSFWQEHNWLYRIGTPNPWEKTLTSAVTVKINFTFFPWDSRWLSLYSGLPGEICLSILVDWISSPLLNTSFIGDSKFFCKDGENLTSIYNLSIIKN